jgi:hypothetical protein
MQHPTFWKPVLFFLTCLSTNLYAQQVQVNVTATIKYIYDSSSVVKDLNVGDQVSGYYIYETDTIDADSSDELGFYPHTMGTGSINLRLGSYQIKSRETADTPLEIMIHHSSSSDDIDEYIVSSHDIESSDELEVQGIFLALDSEEWDQALSSDRLTADIPEISHFTQYHDLYLSGYKDGAYFSVLGTIDSFANATLEAGINTLSINLALVDLKPSGQKTSPHMKYEKRPIASY